MYVDVRTPVVEPTPRHIPLGYIAIVRRLGISRCHPLGVGCAYLVAKSKHWPVGNPPTASLLAQTASDARYHRATTLRYEGAAHTKGSV